MIGKTIGKYRIVERLGRGGMGTVYKAVDETLDREVAVKVLNPELTDTEVMKRFRAEATTLAKLNHPEIATIFEIFRSDTDLLMVMELVRGETLDQLGQRCGPLPPERAAYLVAQVLGALEHAHRAGVVHLDLKPANVMVTDHGAVKIMDFGIAHVAGAEQLTSDGHMMGTPAYMAPEQVAAKKVDARADLYSAGVVFYRLLTGNLPFQADTAIGMVQKQLSDPPTPAHMHRADLPDWCGTILTRALQKSPVDRFQTAEEFRTMLLAQIGAATEHTRAFAAMHGATPQPMPVPAVLATPGRPVAAAIPSAAPALPNPPAVKPTNAQTEGATVVLQKRHLAVGGGLLAVVAAGVVVLVVVAPRRQAPASVAPATPAVEASAAAPAPTAATTGRAATPPATTSNPTAPAASAPDASAPVSTPSSPSPAPLAAPPPTAAAPAAPATKPSAPVAAATPATSQKKPADALAGPTAATEPAASAPPPEPVPEAPEPAPAAAAVHPPFAFDARVVVADGGKNRERETKVRFADGQVTVTERAKNDRVITTLPFSAIVAVNVSNSKQPMWNSPQGPAEMMKVEGGALGFFKGERNWVGFRTATISLVLHVDDQDLRRVIAAIEERTGKTVERVVARKD
jgi:eukaryotic-like serine/threonine-protein kinase